jgi:hypothetical protein
VDGAFEFSLGDGIAIHAGNRLGQHGGNGLE